MRPIIALTAAFALIAPACAQAGTVTPQGLDSAEIAFHAAPGEHNNVVATGDGNQVVTIGDSAPITLPPAARSKCVALSDHEVRCTNRSAWGRLLVLAGDGNDTFTDGYEGGIGFYGGTGSDRLVAGTRAVRAFGTFDGGPGVDEVSWAAGDAPVIVSLGARTARDGRPSRGDAYDIGPGVEVVTGSRFADVITGSARAERFRPGAGDDTVFGVGGADRYDMSTGPDGADRIFGSGRRDVVSYARRKNPVRVVLNGAPVSGEAGEGDALHNISRARRP
jgi:Ca2+-binding RTX toxin-like protein